MPPNTQKFCIACRNANAFLKLADSKTLQSYKEFVSDKIKPTTIDTSSRLMCSLCCLKIHEIHAYKEVCVATLTLADIPTRASTSAEKSVDGRDGDGDEEGQPPRKRGRPKKMQSKVNSIDAYVRQKKLQNGNGPAKKRGRPPGKKNRGRPSWKVGGHKKSDTEESESDESEKKITDESSDISSPLMDKRVGPKKSPTSSSYEKQITQSAAPKGTGKRGRPKKIPRNHSSSSDSEQTAPPTASKGTGKRGRPKKMQTETADNDRNSLGSPSTPKIVLQRKSMNQTDNEEASTSQGTPGGPKRGRPPKTPLSQNMQKQAESSGSIKATPGRRGRPKKGEEKRVTPTTSKALNGETPKKRGRPSKIQAVTVSSPRISEHHENSSDEDDDDDEQEIVYEDDAEQPQELDISNENDKQDDIIEVPENDEEVAEQVEQQQSSDVSNSSCVISDPLDS